MPVRAPQPQIQPQAAQRNLSKSCENENSFPELDAKLLLLGDVGENGTWWTGPPKEISRSRSPGPSATSEPPVRNLTHSPQINWDDLTIWYHIVTNAAEEWLEVYQELSQELSLPPVNELELQVIEADLLQAQEHTQRHLMKATEVLLKRPGRPMAKAADIRFLLVIAENPLLRTGSTTFSGLFQGPNAKQGTRARQQGADGAPTSGILVGQHSGIIKRIVGLMSNSSPECHDQIIAWLGRYHLTRFVRLKELFSGFLNYRIRRQETKKHDNKVDITAGLIPEMQTGRNGAYLHDEIGGFRSPRKNSKSEKGDSYAEDWQTKAAARVLALLFAANNLSALKRPEDGHSPVDLPAVQHRAGKAGGGRSLPLSDFYISLIDFTVDLMNDFDAWESRRSKFAFCQYPFLLSIRAKTEILEKDAQKQMQRKARDAVLDGIMSRRAINQYLNLDVRRDCLVEDSLKAVSEVIGSGSEDVKKALRITFRGEEGIDAGGLRKEWFLMLIREVFNPNHGSYTLNTTLLDSS